MVRYFKEKTILIDCSICKGVGKIEETVYHNQVAMCSCYPCRGTGKVQHTSLEDATTEVQTLKRRIRKYRKALGI